MVYLLCPNGQADYNTFSSRALLPGRKRVSFMVFLSEQSALYVVVLGVSGAGADDGDMLILMFRRSATAEKRVKEMAAAVQKKARAGG